MRRDWYIAKIKYYTNNTLSFIQFVNNSFGRQVRDHKR
jgi:hypothetical protein